MAFNICFRCILQFLANLLSLAVVIFLKIPNDFDSSSNGSAEVDVTLLIDSSGEMGDARLRLRGDFKRNNQQLGSSAGGFAEDTESADFSVIEPVLTDALNHQRVTITLTDSVVDTIEPSDWAFLVLNRIAPTGGPPPGEQNMMMIYIYLACHSVIRENKS